jgi:cell division protein FtsQ
VADQVVEERARRRPGTGWLIAVRRFSEENLTAGDRAARRPAHFARGGTGQHAVIDLRDPSPAPDAAAGAGSAPPATVSAGPDIDPRIRQRRLDVEAERERRRARWLRIAIVALLVAAAAYGVLRSPLLAVRRPRVSGAVQTPPQDVLRAAGLTGHPLMISLQLGRMAAAIDRLPWIATARVRRSWPDTVIVTVTERAPVAVVGGMFVDASGRVLSAAPGFAPYLAVRPDTGASAPAPPAPGGTVAAVYRPGVQVVTTLPPDLRGRIGAVLVRPDGTVRLSLRNGESVLLGDTSALPEKFEAVLTLVERVRSGTATIDVTVPSAPVLTGPVGAGTVSTHTGG